VKILKKYVQRTPSTTTAVGDDLKAEPDFRIVK
jgi:hypothetical protein